MTGRLGVVLQYGRSKADFSVFFAFLYRTTCDEEKFKNHLGSGLSIRPIVLDCVSLSIRSFNLSRDRGMSHVA